MKNEKLEKLVTLSRYMRWLCLALMIVVILAGVLIGLLGALTGASWFFDQLASWNQSGGVRFAPDNVGLMTRLAIVGVNAVTLYFTCRGLWFLMQLFDAFANQEVLSTQTSKLLRHAGFSFLIVAIYGVVARTLSVLLLTMSNPPGQRQLSIGFGSEQLFVILLAGTLFVIGHVLSIAAAIEEENKSFV